MALQEGVLAIAKKDALNLWDRFLAQLIDQVLIVLSTKEVEPGTEMTLHSIQGAVDRTYELLQRLLKRDSRRIFFERQHIVSQEIFKLLDNYNEKDASKLAVLISQLRDMHNFKNRLQA